MWLAEFAEDDAKRAAEQLKGIIHDTEGATCVRLSVSAR
jgi:hypothetical protein